uniref:Zinc metalloproteinase n=1 Tax=Strongyloides venezuelensis TaxID=75913 RepID=A0A0K0EVV5_STRVS
MNFFIELFLFSQCIMKVISNVSSEYNHFYFHNIFKNEGTLKTGANSEFFETRVKKSIVKNMPLRWTFPIDYHIRHDVNRNTVKTALAIIEKETCIRFRETIYFTNGGLNYVNGSSGCVSYVGKASNGKPQDILLGTDCNKVTIAIHETCHALGVIHEMTRHDRNSYIDIKYKNIDPRVVFNFQPYDLSKAISYGLKYDFGSVMHYDRYAGSANELLAMKPKHWSYLKTIGQSTRVAFNDMKQLNLKYCSNKCRNSKFKCKRGGYPDPNKCTVCKCPEFYTKPLCTKLLPSHKSCGPIRLFNTKKIDRELTVSGLKTCYYQITAPIGRKIRLYIVKTELLNNFVCQKDKGLEIKFLADKSVSGAMLCGRNSGKIIISQNNILAM